MNAALFASESVKLPSRAAIPVRVAPSRPAIRLRASSWMASRSASRNSASPRCQRGRRAIASTISTVFRPTPASPLSSPTNSFALATPFSCSGRLLRRAGSSRCGSFHTDSEGRPPENQETKRREGATLAHSLQWFASVRLDAASLHAIPPAASHRTRLPFATSLSFWLSSCDFPCPLPFRLGRCLPSCHPPPRQLTS